MTSARILKKYQKAIKSDLEIVHNARKGVKAQVFFDLIELSGFSKAFLAESIFDISFKTVQRYKAEKKSLNPRDSEIALKILQLFSKGIEIFGSSKSFVNWLEKPSIGLGNINPISFLNTNTGIDLIEEELLRIEFGALA